MLQSLSHYKFRSKLVYKSQTYERKLIVKDEKYTTKTCSKCSYYNDNVKVEKVIECKGCNKKYDRDGSSAQNIYMSVLD